MEANTPQFDEFKKWCLNKTIVIESDMEETIQNEVKDIIISGIDKGTSAAGLNIELACKWVKESMDRQFGPYWHCAMGEGFSFEVTRQAKTTLFMYQQGKIAVLLFKC
mmetsp:Transcript_12261/g.8919  ORF Transcript_12261/g.8919 Transcript_12261/m.8919 type:complete len:108 (-) Transcript_12261:31-354(-)